jgi:hypothetical protein
LLTRHEAQRIVANMAKLARGLFLGTSPSGIGKRYALIDYLSDDDTQCTKFACSSAMTAYVVPFHGHFMGETESPSS